MHNEAVDQRLAQVFSIQSEQLQTLDETMRALNQALIEQDQPRIATLSQAQAHIAEAIDQSQRALKHALEALQFETSESHIREYCLTFASEPLKQQYLALKRELEHCQQRNMGNHVLTRMQLKHCDEMIVKLKDATTATSHSAVASRRLSAYGKDGTLVSEQDNQLLCRI